MCSQAMSDELATAGIGELGKRAYDLMIENEWRKAAEISFALARYYLDRGIMAKARQWAEQSIDSFKKCDTRSEVACVPHYSVIAGIQLPDRIHEGVVKSRILDKLA